MSSHPATILYQTDISALEKILLDESGRLQSVPFAAIRDVPQNDISVFCHAHGVYQIITHELVEFVGERIENFNAVEIGAGNGCLGRSLGIPLTDSKIQDSAWMRDYYRKIGQPRVRYGDDVKKLEALQAVKVLKADAAVGCWVTNKKKATTADGCFGGVDEAILSKRLKRYVFVGNLNTHKTKELLRYCTPTEYRFEWLVSRSIRRSENLIWVFDFKN